MMICHYDDTNSSGGLDKQARLLSHTLRDGGEDVIMLASTRKYARAGWTDDRGVPVRYFWTYASPQVSGRYLPAALIWAVQLFFWVWRNRAKIDVIHGHQIRIHAFVGALANRFFGIPAILKSATGGEGADIKAIGSRKYFGAPGRNFVIRHTDIFIATTKSIEEDLLRFNVPAEKIRIIPNGLPLAPPAPGAPAEVRSRRALFLGRLAPDKNAPELARAACELADGASLTVDFYGRGRELPQLEAALAAAGNPAVTYRGFVDHPGTILRDYGYLLLPSNAEGLSNAMLEAMAHGVVPVATRVSGCVDHITPGITGFFFDSISHEDLLRGLRLVPATSVEEWQRMSAAAETYARAHFDISNVAGSYRQLYGHLSGGQAA
ncbi:glycosyl transferase group 1 [Parvibaculum lavamentivorans DS-1]|uniref:Glycosyl transferase group 1 n=1 Tax=Parvibaculum lavamentivorans (strain DS-1 / DSM 13023 / NCIMB 13966) TaxID=402881 RepID=A7HUE5_PARL1|nr:glycosyltransferase family 4 protein [Parvibaculum lavamentivorans]ABS63528.1 glycosyl transferase group 1 [Parvibaculum lavamentivorans DS-1]